MRRVLLGVCYWLATIGARRRAWEAQDEHDADLFLVAIRDAR
jgi:hypothetical protein